VTAANRLLTLVVSLALVIVGVTNLAAGRVPLGTAVVLIGILLGTMQVRSPRTTTTAPNVGSAFVVVLVVWVIAGLLVDALAGRALTLFSAGAHHSVPEGLVACLGLAMFGFLFALASIALRRGMQKLRRGRRG
jgi:Ca2+/Na+ antiporter